MKLLIRLAILALAAVGARSLFERIRPRVMGATGAGSVVSNTLSPAFRDAASSVRDASTRAAHEMADATREAAHELRDSAAAAATPEPTAPPAGTDSQPRGAVG
jgi:hypothetical protein